MNRLLKTFLLWLLIAVLPLNAVAGSLGMSCAPNHGRSHQQSPGSASASASASAASEHAHHGAEHAQHAAALSADTDVPAPDVEKQAHGSCSACSVFCIGAVAPPSSRLALPSFDGADAAVASPTALLVGFIQDGPQRPPRHSFA